MAFTQDDFTVRLINDMDPRLLAFIKKMVNTFIKWDIIKFFHQNPNTTDTAANIARYVGRDFQDVAVAMEELTQDGLLVKKPLKGAAIYRLTNNQVIRRLMEQFVTACRDRHFRVKAVFHIIQKMQS